MSLVCRAGGSFARRLTFAVTLVAACLSAAAVRGQLGPGGGVGDPPGRFDEGADFDARLRSAGGPQYSPSGDDQKLVTDLRILGNETVGTSKIYELLRTRKDRLFDPDIVKADVRRLITSGLFRNVKTFTEPLNGGVAVTFQVFERSSIRYIKYVGNRGLNDKVLGRESGLKVGDTLNVYNVEEGRRKIEEYYHQKGFPKTHVSIFEGDQPEDRGVVFVISEGPLERIASVRFVGNDPNLATDARLKTQIQSKPGYFYYLMRGRVDRAKIDADIERLTAYYRSLGYFKARVSRELEYDNSGRWLTLTFVIDEGPQYTVETVTINGVQRFDRNDLQGQLKMQAGQPFNLSKMNRDINTLRDVYGAHGHIFADIQADPRFREEPGKLDLVYTIEEGKVYSVGEINVHIAGEHPHTRQSVVLNRISARPGDPINAAELRSSERRLKASQLFENDPTQGVAPRIVVRPPELEEIEALAEQAGDASFRGQSPDPPRYGQEAVGHSPPPRTSDPSPRPPAPATTPKPKERHSASPFSWLTFPFRQ